MLPSRTVPLRLEKAYLIVAAVAIFIAVYFGSSVLAPVAFALFIIAIVWPLQSRLQSHLPKLLALAVVILLIVVVFVAFASFVAWGFSRVGRLLVADSARYQQLYEQVTTWLEGHGIAVAGLWAEHFNMRWLIGAVQRITGHVHTTIGFWLVVLVYVILGLLEVDDMVRKLQARRPPSSAGIC